MPSSRRRALCASMVTAATLFAPPSRRSPSESTEVLRAQVELSVCEDRSAGTSDPVSARLSDGEGQVTWLDRPGDDFGHGGRYRYDLLVEGVRTLAEITELSIEKPGDDDLCLSAVTLIVNSRPIFFRSYSGGAWLGASTHNVLRTSGTELRSNAAWQAYTWSLPEWISTTGASVARQEVADRLTSQVASAMHDLGLQWRSADSSSLMVTHADDSTVHASAMLAREVPYWLNTDVALEFDLRLCGNGHPEPMIVNVAAREASHWYAAVSSRDRTMRDAQTLMQLRARLTRARPLVLAGGLCPHVDADANILY
jgi:hypothetical protein